MTRGIRFEVPNEYGKILSEMLENVDVNKYHWYNIESEDQVFSGALNNKFLFDNDTYDGNDFKDKIGSDNYYVYFVKLQAYSTKTNYSECTSYEEFCMSDCKIVIFVIDAIFVDVYAKDTRIIEIIKGNAEKNNYLRIEYILKENDRCFV